MHIKLLFPWHLVCEWQESHQNPQGIEGWFCCLPALNMSWFTAISTEFCVITKLLMLTVLSAATQQTLSLNFSFLLMVTRLLLRRLSCLPMQSFNSADNSWHWPTSLGILHKTQQLGRGEGLELEVLSPIFRAASWLDVYGGYFSIVAVTGNC